MSSSQGEVVEEMVIGVDIDYELHSDSGSTPPLPGNGRSSNPLSRSSSSQDLVDGNANDADDDGFTRRRPERDQERGEIRETSNSNDITGRFEISDGEGDEEYRRKGFSARVLFIHGLSRQSTEQALKDRFSQYGTVTALHIPFNAVTRTPKIYGFIRMSTTEEATAALEGENGKNFLGQAIEVERAKRGEQAEKGDRKRQNFGGRSYSGASDSKNQRNYAGRPNNATYRREYSPQPPPTRYAVRDDYPIRDNYPPPRPATRYPPTAPPRQYYEPAEVRRRDPYDMPPAPYRPRDPYGYDYPPGPPPPSRHYPREYPPAPAGPPSGRYAAPPPAPYYDPPAHAYDYPPAGPYRSGPPPPGERPMPPRRRYDGPPLDEDPAYPPRYDRHAGNPGSRPYHPGPPGRGRSPPPPNARY